MARSITKMTPVEPGWVIPGTLSTLLSVLVLSPWPEEATQEAGNGEALALPRSLGSIELHVTLYAASRRAAHSTLNLTNFPFVPLMLLHCTGLHGKGHFRTMPSPLTSVRPKDGVSLALAFVLDLVQHLTRDVPEAVSAMHLCRSAIK